MDILNISHRLFFASFFIWRNAHEKNPLSFLQKLKDRIIFNHKKFKGLK